MKPDDIPRLPRGVRLHNDRVRGQWVLLAPERALMIDMVGHAVLSEVDGHRTFREIVDELASRFDAPREQISKDCSGLLDALRNRRILDVAK